MSNRHDPVRYTATEIKILDLLSDGQKHPRKEVMALVKEHHDSEADKGTLKSILFSLRNKLSTERPGELITTETQGYRVFFRRCRSISSKVRR